MKCWQFSPPGAPPQCQHPPVQLCRQHPPTPTPHPRPAAATHLPHGGQPCWCRWHTYMLGHSQPRNETGPRRRSRCQPRGQTGPGRRRCWTTCRCPLGRLKQAWGGGKKSGGESRGMLLLNQCNCTLRYTATMHAVLVACPCKWLPASESSGRKQAPPCSRLEWTAARELSRLQLVTSRQLCSLGACLLLCHSAWMPGWRPPQ